MCHSCMKKIRDGQAQSRNQQKCVVCGQTASQGGLLCSRCREAKQEETNIMSERREYIIRQDIEDASTLKELKNATLNMFEYLTGD